MSLYPKDGSYLPNFFHISTSAPKRKDTVAPCGRGNRVHRSVECEGAGGADRSTVLRSTPRCRQLCDNNVLAEQQIGGFKKKSLCSCSKVWIFTAGARRCTTLLTHLLWLILQYVYHLSSSKRVITTI